MTNQLVRPPTLTKVVADSIRESMFRGGISPGDPLREVELSESMGVARGTVREALRILRHEDLVDVIPHRGAYVKELSPQAAKELYTLRALLEPYAVRLALENQAYSEQDLDTLEMLAQQALMTDESAHSVSETIEADVEFHRLMCRRSNHELLVGTLDRLQSLTRLFLYNISLYPSDEYTNEPSHHDICAAIRSGDSSRAEEVLRNHINSFGTDLLIQMDKVEMDPIESGEAE